jgi:GAF domain-containing protein
MVVALAQATIAPADGVSVSLRRNGRLATVAATDQTILDMDTYQYATGEGPCLDASIEGRAFQTQSLIDERRWPAFTPSAHALGINAILSSPLRASKQPVGALNIYSRQPSAFASDDQKLASVFAIEASIILTEARVDVSAEDRATRFQSALLVRETIAQAQGVLMGREGISGDDAFTLLRTHSQLTGQPLFERAQEIIASLRRPQRDRGTGTTGDPNG